MGRVFFFFTRSASPASAASNSLVPLDSISERFLRRLCPVQRPRPLYGLQLRVVSFFDAHANHEIPVAWGFPWASPWQNLSPNKSVNCLRAVLLRRTTIRASRPFLERLNVAKTRPPFDGHHMREVSFLNARTR